MRILSRRLPEQSVQGRVWLLAVSASFLMACVANVPPPKTPAKSLPELPDPPGPPAQGEGLVVVDATNGPATVEVVALTVGATRITGNLCAATPCAVTLPYGTYDVIIKGKNDQSLKTTDSLRVGRNPTVFRTTMGQNYSGGAANALGALAATGGVITGGIGLLLHATGSDSYWGTIGVGAALTGLGIILMAASPARVQPGSSVQWTPDGAAAPPASPSTASKQVVLVTPNGFGVTF